MTNDYYKTPDLGIAATLTAAGFKFVDIDKTNPRKLVFYFVWTEEIEDCVARYWSGELKAQAIALIESYKYLKSSTYL